MPPKPFDAAKRSIKWAFEIADIWPCIRLVKRARDRSWVYVNGRCVDGVLCPPKRLATGRPDGAQPHLHKIEIHKSEIHFPEIPIFLVDYPFLFCHLNFRARQSAGIK